MAEADQTTAAPSPGAPNGAQTDHSASQLPVGTTIAPVTIESSNSSAIDGSNSKPIEKNVPQDEPDEVEESFISDDSKEDSLEDTNEVEENIHSPVIAEPEPESESVEPLKSAANGTGKQEISTSQVKLSSLFDQDEGNDKTEADSESLAEPKTLSDSSEDNHHHHHQQQISRRAFLRHKSIAEGIKRRRKLFAKGRNPKRRRRKRFNKNSALSKSSQTRQSSTTAGYGNLIISDAVSSSPALANSGASSLTETIRQRFPSLANPLQLSSAVQRLIMSKQSAQAAAGHQFQPNRGYTRHYQYNRYQQPNSQPSDFAQEQQLSPANPATLFQQANGLMDSSRLAEQIGIGNWASSDDLPALVASPGASNGGDSGSSSSGNDNNGGGTDMRSKPVIPIEIIGLDPSVGSSILNGLHNGPDNHQHLLDPESSTSIRHQQLSSNLQNAFRGDRNLAQQADHQRPRAPSILHVHHFHTQGRPISQLAGLPAHQLAGPNEADQTLSGSPFRGSKEPSEESGEQVLGAASGGRPARPASKVTQQQVFVNQKGELVYLTVEDQSGIQVPSSGQEVTGEVSEQQQVGEEQVEALPQSETVDSTADQQQQQQQQATATVNQLDQSGQQQESAGSNANEPTIYLKASHLASALKQSSQDSTRPQLFVTNTGQTISLMGVTSDQQGESSQQAASNGETEGDRQQLLMVAYRPQSVNTTAMLKTNHLVRSPYNDGQESKTSSVSNGSSEPPAGVDQLFKSAQAETINAANQQQQQQELGQPGNGPTEFSPQPQMVNVHPAKVALPSKTIVQLDPDNRVPYARPLFVDSQGGVIVANKDTGKDELAYLAANWFKGPIGVDTQSNGYANARVPIIGFTNASSAQQHGYQQSLVENSALFKHLKQVMLADGNKMLQQPVQPAQVRFNGNHLFSGNSTKLTSDQLLGLIQGLQRQEIGGSNKSSNTLQSSMPNIRLVNSHPKAELSSLAIIDQANSKPIGRFELAQASNQSPAKLMRNPQSVNVGVHSNRSSSPLANPSTVLPVYRKDLRNRLVVADNNAIAQDLGSTNKHAPNSTGKLGVNPQVRPPMNSLESIDSEDGSGLSNIALAFIFVVSLITLAIITASMIYRHKRRSVSRCADLQARSRLNLTQRTKHFVCSNFVSPNDVASIKSINLATSNSSLSKTKSSNSSRGSDTGTSTISSIPGISRLQANRYNSGCNNGSGSKPLSSFNHSSQVVEKYQRNTENNNNPVTDIKTLNTRLQKPSYLKSLISRPDCLLTNSKNREPQLASSRADSAGGGSCYLNIRHRSADISGRRQLGDSKLEDSSRLQNRSFKKFDCDSRLSPHGSSMKINAASSSPKRAKHSLGGTRRMSTIISVEDPFDPAICEPSQASKSCTNVARRLAKLNNLPAPKPPDLTQIDRL